METLNPAERLAYLEEKRKSLFFNHRQHYETFMRHLANTDDWSEDVSQSVLESRTEEFVGKSKIILDKIEKEMLKLKEAVKVKV